MKKTALGIVLILLITFSVVGVDYFSAMSSYNKLRRNAESPILEAVPIEQREQEFINQVQRSWNSREIISPINPMMEMCELTGFEQTVGGLLSMLTHEVPPFSLLDKDRNIKEAGRAGGLSQLKKLAIRDKVYWKEGVLYMMIQDDIVEYYEDTDNGVRHILYKR